LTVENHDSNSSIDIEQRQNSAIFKVKVVPGSSRTALMGVYHGMLKVKVSAPPEKGKANMQLVDFLAKKLNVKKNTLDIIAGKTNAVKYIKASSLSAEYLIRKINTDD